MNPFVLPAAATAAMTAQAPSLPSPPPRAGLWDPGNRHKTLLAIGTGLLSGRSFGEGVAQAGANVMGLGDQLDARARKTREFGGPDDAFEIVTDAQTGERSVREIPAFREYLDHKRVKQKDVADINGRAMYGIEQLDPKDRPAAYAAMLANPEYYGIDPSTMPATYDPTYGAMTASMGMTVAQAATRKQAGENAESLDNDRQTRAADRAKRTEIAAGRAASTTRQGDERIAISRAKGSGSGASSGGKPRGGKTKVGKGNADLLYLLN